MKTDEELMELALKEANKCLKIDEVPVGCIVVDENGKIIGKGHNKREKKFSVFAHAEIEAILRATRKKKDWQLPKSAIYITLEPCVMCTGAILQSRFKKIVYGAFNPKAGGLGGTINILEANNLNVHPIVIGGIMEKECSTIITNYFRNKRSKC